MTYADTIKHLSSRYNLPQTKIKEILKSSTIIIKNILDQDIGISIPGLGTFHTHVVQKRKYYNPYYKCLMLLPQKRVIHFRASSSLKDEIKDTRIVK
jgi:nucleoid DNA-binding protein